VTIVETLSGDKVANDPAAPVFIVVKVHEMVAGDNIWAKQDNAIISATSMIVVFLGHRHIHSLTELRDEYEGAQRHPDPSVPSRSAHLEPATAQIAPATIPPNFYAIVSRRQPNAVLISDRSSSTGGANGKPDIL
jgi:hypothetical protein